MLTRPAGHEAMAEAEARKSEAEAEAITSLSLAAGWFQLAVGKTNNRVTAVT